MEEIDLGETQNHNIKQLEFIEDNINYKYQIKINKEYLHVSSINDNKIKYEGTLHISNIQYHLGIYNYNINEIFDAIYILNNNKFDLIKDVNKYILKIELLILNQKRYIKIELFEKINKNDDKDYMETINELKKIIKEQDDKIKLLEEELNIYKNKNGLYDNFNIKNKKPKYTLKYLSESICCSTVLKDGRFVTGSSGNSITIYNNKTFKPDLIIKEHNDGVNNVIQLSSGDLASCSEDKTIKLYNINGNKYKVIQTLSYHSDKIKKIIELKNKKLASCSSDKSIIFYSKDNGEYKKDYYISTNGTNGPIIQIKDNEICYYEGYDTICFYDLIKKNNIKNINNIRVINHSYDSLLMISKDLLLITGENIISIVDINLYNLIRTIEVSGSGKIYAACMLNKDMILTADANKRIIQWKIENDNLKLLSKKEKAHNDRISTLSKLGNGFILSGSNCVKIW